MYQYYIAYHESLSSSCLIPYCRMFKIEYETDSSEKTKANPWQNSWGMTTRTIGVMIMTHADNKGLVLPPRVAQIQVVVIPIPNKKLSEETVQAMYAKVEEISKVLKESGISVTTDCRENYTPGWKYNHWELKGVPIRLELGPRDLESGCVMLARRDTGEKSSVSWDAVVPEVPNMLDRIQKEMLQRARETFDACIERATNWDDFMAALERKHMVLTPWADEESIEEDVKRRSATPDAMGAKTLCMPLEQPELPEGTPCFVSGKPAKNWVLWGRSY